MTSEQPTLYRIGPDDILRIIVLGEPDLGLTVPVRPDGRFSMPLLEDIEAAGRTPADLAAAIEANLADYLRVPSVTVEVLEATGTFDQQIRVIGTAVGPRGGAEEGDPVGPRAIPYREGITLLDVIIAVGGLSEFAAGNRAYIMRRTDGDAVEIPVRLEDLVERGDPSANVAMAPGDVLLVPEGFFRGDWIITPTASASITFTDNIDLAPDEFKEAAIIPALAPGVGIRADATRIKAAVDAALNLRYIALLNEKDAPAAGAFQFAGDAEEEGLDVTLDFLGRVNTEVVRDLFFIDTAASVSQQAASSEEATSVSDNVETNQETVTTFLFSPYVENRFGNFGESRVAYIFNLFRESGNAGSSNESSGLFGGDAQTDVIHTLQYQLASGPQFTQLAWGFDAYASRESSEDEGDVTRAGAVVDFAYPLDDAFSLLAAAGWEYRKEEVDDERDVPDDINGPTWRVGGRYAPNPRLNAELTYGRTDGDTSLRGDLRYQVTPKTRIFASYEERLETSAERFSRNLSTLSVSETGVLIDPASGLPFDPRTDPGDIRDDTQRVRLLRAGFIGNWANNSVAVTATYSSEISEDDESSNDDEKIAIITARWSRPVSRQTVAALTTVYQREDQFDGVDNTYRIQGSFSYDVNPYVQAFASYGFQVRRSDVDRRDFTENAVTVGVTGTF